jgi:hypothetical protein
MKRPWGIVPHALVLFPSAASILLPGVRAAALQVLMPWSLETREQAKTVSTPATKTLLSGSPLSWSPLRGILHSDCFRATQMASRLGADEHVALMPARKRPFSTETTVGTAHRRRGTQWLAQRGSRSLPHQDSGAQFLPSGLYTDVREHIEPPHSRP